MSTARKTVSQAAGENSAEAPSSAAATRLLIQYRQSLLRELAEVDRLLAEQRKATTGSGIAGNDYYQAGEIRLAG